MPRPTMLAFVAPQTPALPAKPEDVRSRGAGAPLMLGWLGAAHRAAKGWDTSIVVAVLIWIVLRSFLIDNKAVYGGELEIPGMGIRLLHAPGYADPQRDGIAVFRSVEDSTPNLNIVKRVIGAAGDTLQMVHDTVVL